MTTMNIAFKLVLTGCLLVLAAAGAGATGYEKTAKALSAAGGVMALIGGMAAVWS